MNRLNISMHKIIINGSVTIDKGNKGKPGNIRQYFKCIAAFMSIIALFAIVANAGGAFADAGAQPTITLSGTGHAAGAGGNDGMNTAQGGGIAVLALATANDELSEGEIIIEQDEVPLGVPAQNAGAAGTAVYLALFVLAMAGAGIMISRGYSLVGKPNRPSK